MRRIAVIMLIALVSCKKKSTENDILKMDDMKTIMWDMINADEWFNQIPIKDSLQRTRQTNIRLYEQVFASHKITKKQFYNSYQFYEKQPDRMKILLDSVNAYGDRIKNSYKGPKKY